MNSSTICSLFLGLILISQSPFAANATLLGLGGGGGPLVSLICAASSNKVECNKVLSSPQITQAKNYKQLSKAITEIAMKKAVEGQAFLKGLAQKSKSEGLNICADSCYSSVVRDFKSCLDFIDGDPDTLSYDCKVAVDEPTRCDSAMAANHIVNPAVTALNRQILFLCELIFKTIDKLPNH
ncbi:putative pectinesterase inhibitor domain-containing protein [Medicago truncatula]|uniref:Plant invertase/pectin methylesterase inhibitor protein n=1 Tax=Medicago truncatula TaxID=3880 RepID=G7IBW9_MEDTR|nr:uncharacterized protein LOC11422432 [Medicago truncatula]AES62323.1 plant invertase/pectin methylesterase inhibitor protein [Medicago truncatula]RHN81669.1 putative pectinesterase inhibitor domain-containing protein [Medicago truncatula]